MRLDLFDLQLFLYVVEHGSLTKGAERAAISLQATSERIKKIEQQFNVSLFTRHATGIKLTLAGHTFLHHAQVMIQHAQSMQHAMLPFAQGLVHHITLWCNSSAQSEYLPQLLPEYLIDNPNLKIDLKEAESHDIIQALHSGTAQLGLISSFFDAADLETLEFAEDPLVLICPRQHQISKKDSVELSEVLDYPFVGLMQYHSLQQSIEAQAQLLHCEIHYRLRLPNFAALAQVVANGVGIAIMPKRAALRLSPHYSFDQVNISGAWANRQLLLAAKHFDDLSLPYQHLTAFLMRARQKLQCFSNTDLDLTQLM